MKNNMAEFNEIKHTRAAQKKLLNNKDWPALRIIMQAVVGVIGVFVIMGVVL